MDLQAILDGTESSDESSSNHSRSPLGSSSNNNNNNNHSHNHNYNSNAYSMSESLTEENSEDRSQNQFHHPGPSASRRYQNQQHIHSRMNSSDAVDLEQILREDDDFDRSTSDSGTNDEYDIHTSEDVGDWQDTTPPQSSSSHRYTQGHTSINTGEDWDVLQAILGEEDDDDDEDFEKDEYDHEVVAITGTFMPSSKQSRDNIPGYNSTKHERRSEDVSYIDAILQQSDDEEDSEGELRNDFDPILNTSIPNIMLPTNTNHFMPSHDVGLVSNDIDLEPTKSAESFQTANQSENEIPSDRMDQLNATGPNAHISELELEKASKNALQRAQGYERKLLKSGHRDIVSPLMVKRRLKPRIPLQSKQQQKDVESDMIAKAVAANVDRGGSNKITAATPAGRRFHIAGALETSNLEKVSAALVKALPDLPTALCANSRFMAIGTQRGVVLVFDFFESLRKRLTHGGDTPFDIKTAGSVTTIDLSTSQGEILIAGYTSGYIVLWDAIKGVALRTVIETHNPSPITNIRFLTDLKVVTVDAGGLVHKLNFTKNILWASYSVESECLLDGTAGQILATDVLDPSAISSTNAATQKAMTPGMKEIVLIALSSERSSFAVAVEPTVHVLHRWAKPPDDEIMPQMDTNLQNNRQIFLPCLSWGWALVSGGGNATVPILARAWGCSIQFLLASFQEEEDGPVSSEAFPWPAFGVHDEFQSSAPVVALAWLNDRTLAYLTANNEFTVVDTVMMTLLERLDFSGFRLVYAEFSLSRSVPAEGGKSFCTTFQNSIRSRDDRLLLLCQEDLQSVSIVGAKRRISLLEQDGEWLEALASALDHYENTISSQQDRRRQRKKDISKHPEYTNSVRSDEEEWIAKLLIRYLNIAIENAPENTEYDLAHSHFQMLAGVCVEFCVVTKRLDMLFGPIFRRFHVAGFLSVFLDVLEPYILNDKLDYIAPEAMAHFVEHCRSTNGIATVERCLLHMDVTIMDFDSILTLLRANNMYSALFYVYNQGLDDYTAPLEILLEKIFDDADTNAPMLVTMGRYNGQKNYVFESFGYKAILYLQYCFTGRTFPQDEKIEDLQRLSLIRSQLLRFLLQKEFSPSSIRKPTKVIGVRGQLYPYAHILLLVDPKAMLDTLSMAMDALDSDFQREPVGGWEVEVGVEQESDAHSKYPDRQEIIGMLLSIIMPGEGKSDTIPGTVGRRSDLAIKSLLDFLAEYLMKGVVRANKQVTFMILNRMAARFESATDPQDRLRSQASILQLLSALPRNSYEAEEVLILVQKSGIHRAALLLHQEGATSWRNIESQHDVDNRSYHFRAAVDCYLDDDDNNFRKEVFSYIKKECSGSSSEHNHVDDPMQIALRAAVISKLTALVQLDPLLAAELVAELFVDDIDHVIDQLGNEHAQYLFLQAIISGDLDQKDQVAGSMLNTNLTMEHHHKYLALMAKLHPENVYKYLQTHDNYRPETCLPLCQKYDIADASCYLLERMGNVSSGLQLILQTLEGRMMGLKRIIRGMGTKLNSKYNVPRYFPSKKRANSSSDAFTITGQEIESVKRVLIVALDLCERNSGTFSARTAHGSQLWFKVLDRLINAKGFLRLSKEQPGHAKVMAGVLSELLQLTMQRMVSSVPLPDLVRKVTSDHSGSRLGELREMVESLLSTYGFELNVFSGAVKVFQHDARHMQRRHHDLRLQGASVRKVMNIALNEQGSTLQTNDGDVLQIGESGNATLVDSEGRPQRPHTANSDGLGNMLGKLRTRRQHTGQHNRRPASTVTQLNFMTDQERLFTRGEMNPDDVIYWEDHVSGILGEAEHRGRLMSFAYS